MGHFSDVFSIYKLGRLTVVGFPATEIPDYDRSLCGSMDLHKLLNKVGCEVLAVDLTAATFIPSGILGLLVSFRKFGIEVFFFNPSDEIRRMLEVTKLERFIHVEHVDLGPLPMVG